MEERLKDLIVEYCMNCYKENKYPIDLKITCYADFRKFRMFWIEHAELKIDNAISYYLAFNNETETN